MHRIGTGVGGRRAATTGIVLASVLALAGCTDPALVDRVAAMERSQDQLRTSLRELGAPDTDAIAARESLASDVAAIDGRLDAIDGELTALTDELAVLVASLEETRTLVEAGAQEDDERLTSLEVQLGEVGSQLSTVRDSLTALTDDVSSIEVQLESHVDDPGAHTGAPGTP